MKNKNSHVFLYILSFFGVLFWVSYISDKIHNDPPLNYDPHHAVNGIDTVYTSDSIYTIEVKIKNADAQPDEDRGDYR